MVMIPSRPKNISTIRMICDAVPSELVMPVVRPTVQSAEMVSYSAFSRLTWSAMLKNAAPRPDSSSTRMKSAEAFSTACRGIRRFMTCTLVLPRAVDHADSRITPTVAVLTPPAVEPEEPPTSISRSDAAFDTSDSAFWSKVANPAVRSVTD